MVKHFGLSALSCAFAAILLLAACTQTDTETLQQLGMPGSAERYVVVLSDSPRPTAPAAGRAAAARVARAHGLQVTHLYGAAVVGFSARVPAARLEGLRRNPRVSYIERDRQAELYGQETPTGISRMFAPGNLALAIDGSDDARIDVDVAVLDTGIDFEHPDLDVTGGVDCTSDSPFEASCMSGGDDDHYHGTHVAGTIAALDNDEGVVGVAPGARLWSVKVLDSSGNGWTSWIVAGIDWVTANAATIEVANMSLGAPGFSQAEYDAIQGAVDAGVAFAVAAGNDGADAGGYSPAAFDNVLTVSALADFDGLPGGAAGSSLCGVDSDDSLADFSNWGSSVQLAAPGFCILSTIPLELGEYGLISGTSMASPHAAGALALLASANNPDSAPAVLALYGQVIGSGNFDWSDDSGDGHHEPLLDVSDATIFAPATTTATVESDDGGGDDGGGDDGGGDDGSGDDADVVEITLSASGYKVKGLQRADLSWSGASSGNVDLFRDSRRVATATNDGAYTDYIGKKGKGSYSYQLCEEGTGICSETVDLTF